jgi:hypothetical protein
MQIYNKILVQKDIIALPIDKLPLHKIQENLQQWSEISQDSNTNRSQQTRYTGDLGQHSFDENIHLGCTRSSLR